MQKNSHYLCSFDCINACVRGYNCCQTGIELSKCVYLASITILLAVNIKSACLMAMPAETWVTTKLNDIHAKLNNIEFGCKFCRVYHLGRLPVIFMVVHCLRLPDEPAISGEARRLTSLMTVIFFCPLMYEDGY